MTEKKPAEPERVICPKPCQDECEHKHPHERKAICRYDCGTIGFPVRGCVPYKPEDAPVQIALVTIRCEIPQCFYGDAVKTGTYLQNRFEEHREGIAQSRLISWEHKPEVRTTSASTPGKPCIESTGRASLGFSYGFSSCPMHREVALGAETRLRLLRIHRDSTTGIEVFITTLPKLGVIHCVCRATVPNIRERFCVLDVDNRVIMSQENPPERFAGAASPKPNASTSSTEKNSDSENETDTTPAGGRKPTHGRKRIVPIVAKSGGKESGTHNAMRTP
jgi:hypothetical protein